MIPTSWTDELLRPIRDRRTGATLRTRDDARLYLLALPPERSHHPSWQHVAKVLLNDADPEQIATQIEYALLLDGALGFPPKR